MSDLYTVHFVVGEEKSKAPFELLTHAKIIANALDEYDDSITNVHVTDEFKRDDDGYPITVYEP